MDEVVPVPHPKSTTCGPSLAPATLGHPWPSQIFSSLDQQFARFMVRQSGVTGVTAERFELLVKRLSASLAGGHSCLPLDSEEEQFLRKNEMVSPGLTTPLVLWRGRLYLQRYYHYELRLAEQIRAMAQVQSPLTGALDTGTSGSGGHSCAIPGACDTWTSMSGEFSAVLAACFDREEKEDRQRRAAEMALQRPLALISGGPGTGKTSTVARILGLLLLTLGTDLRIALAAPTGKAAMRLRESISRNREELPFSASIKEKIPATASTLHRLLGVRRYSPHFRHNHVNPLPWDVVVVDEASMVDLAMMSKLVDALKPGARLILLGDKDQLASVESGAILADCIQALPENTVTLQKSYRFNQEISAFARAVNSNDGTAAWAMLARTQGMDAPVSLAPWMEKERPAGAVTDRDVLIPREPGMAGAVTDRDVLIPREPGMAEAVSLLHEPPADFIVTRYTCYMREVTALRGDDDIRSLFHCLNRFRVLCATRHGAGGVETINRQVELALAAGGYPCQPGGWYPGRPVMVLHNDYGLNLFNGDIGICLPDLLTPGTFKVWFEGEDGSLKGYQPYRLPACESVFAMTIHKSQGSEFGEVLVVLPKVDTPLLTRELIYTAVTRAQARVLIAGDQDIFNAAISRSISRSSGLHEMLMGLP